MLQLCLTFDLPYFIFAFEARSSARGKLIGKSLFQLHSSQKPSSLSLDEPYVRVCTNLRPRSDCSLNPASQGIRNCDLSSLYRLRRWTTCSKHLLETWEPSCPLIAQLPISARSPCTGPFLSLQAGRPGLASAPTSLRCTSSRMLSYHCGQPLSYRKASQKRSNALLVHWGRPAGRAKNGISATPRQS